MEHAPQDRRSITRSELYERAWDTPLSKLGPELGFSDVGLAKLCRRHNIPLPGAGYWAKMAAGKAPPQPSLPYGDDDEIDLPPQSVTAARQDVAAAVRIRQHVEIGLQAASDVAVWPLPATLEDCHPLVRRTAKFFADVRASLEAQAMRRSGGGPRWSISENLRFTFSLEPTSFGRYSTPHGCLNIAATLERVDWILRFHEALIRSLIGAGLKIRPGSPDAPRPRMIHVASGPNTVYMSFVEAFTRRVTPPSAGLSWSQTEFARRDFFKLRIDFSLGVRREWAGTPEVLEESLEEIVRFAKAAPQAQARRVAFHEAQMRERQAALDAELAEAAALEAVREAARQRDNARANQRGRALAVAKALDEYRSIERLLWELGEQVAHRSQAESEVADVWIGIVRSLFPDPMSALLNELASEADGNDRPLWWPYGKPLVDQP